MPRFIAIDGLRAWMAWVVVITHIIQQSSSAGGGEAWIKLDIGGEAVNVFIIISGFVITHLLVERPGPYFSYIIPRFMRLFPAFFVACIVGGLVYTVGNRWAAPAWFEPLHGSDYRSLVSYFPIHVVAHITMLHGLIPNTIVPNSEYVFSPPGWSVSLEWQFYLIAPLAIWLCGSKSRAVWLVVAVVACFAVYHLEFKPLWDRPSILVGAAKFFLIGIACRYAAPSLAGRVTFVAATGLGLGFTVFWMGAPAIAVWMVVFSFILREDRCATGIDRYHIKLMSFFLETRFVQFVAERSYSTYLFHWSVIMVIGTVATSNGWLGGTRLGVLMLLTIPVTFIVQEPVYRFVEVPGRNWGRRWARRFGAKPVAEVAQEVLTDSSAR